jgi:hypothetical protein
MKIMYFILVFYLALPFNQIGIAQSPTAAETQIEKDTTTSCLKISSSRLIHEGEITLKNSNNRTVFEFLFPSIIALIVALIAFGGSKYNLNKQLKESRIQLQKQLESTQETIKMQIAASREIMELQIKNNKENAELDFRQNVLSANRQEWIDKLRHSISRLSSRMLVVGTNKPKGLDEYEEIMEIVSRVELMLNVNDPKDSHLIEILRVLPGQIYNYSKGDKKIEINKIRREIIDSTKIILKTEWERVKKGE